ncbi:MAG TPA: electron transfer flavoprotein subunit alpha/FixB family protein [Candidatus Krumholzibacteria bacterium]|nr:electron transfer flavoprotein subunit alpha/FixB family protein [Candidatus Krumholzibacteria bacterium]
MAKGVLVFGEVRGGALKPITRELVSAANQLAQAGGGSVAIAVIGEGADAAVAEAKSLPVAKVFTAKHALLASYSSQAYAAALAAVVTAADAGIVLFGATVTGRDLSARTAARCGASLFADCTELSLVGDVLHVRRPVYSGKVYAELESSAPIQMASIRPNVFPPVSGSGSAEVVDVPVQIDDAMLRGRVVEVVETSTGAKDLTEAEVIVSGGRSLKSAENFSILEDLAKTIGASVGASRAAVDAGYRPHSAQVGQTGKVVNPRLYFAVGISGAIQHLVGMRTSKVIVAINKDENAPIFQKADYGIVGDLFDVVPKVTEEFKKLLGT